VGHYDSAYEFEANKQRAERKADAKEFLLTLDRLKTIAEGPIDLPQRFLDALTDMANWVEVTIKPKTPVER